MKKFFIIVLVFLGIVFTLYGVFFVFVNVKGKEILVKNLEKHLKEKVYIDSVSLKFPFILEIENLQSQDASFKKVLISLGGFNPFLFHIDINDFYVQNLILKIKREKEKNELRPFFERKFYSTQKNPPLKKNSPLIKKNNFSFKIKNAFFEKASLIFIDEIKKKTFILEDIDLKLKNISYPTLAKFYINMNASLSSEEIKMVDALRIKGWIDYFNKNMDCKLFLRNIDYFIFSPYYSSSWRPSELGLKKAIFSLDSHFKSQNNNLVVENTLFVEKIEFIEDEEENYKKDSLKMLIAAFKEGEEKPTFHFVFQTKMDNPRLDFSLIRAKLKENIKIPHLIENLIRKTKRKVSEKVKETKEITVDTAIDTIKGVIDIFKGILIPKKDSQE